MRRWRRSHLSLLHRLQLRGHKLPDAVHALCEALHTCKGHEEQWSAGAGRQCQRESAGGRQASLCETPDRLFCRPALVTYRKSANFQPLIYMTPRVETRMTPPYVKMALLLQGLSLSRRQLHMGS